jgi:hypothetical protein
MKFNIKKTISWLIFFAFLLLFIYPVSVLAYVDPGSVTLLLQVASAFVLGSIITFRNRILTAFKIFILRKPVKKPDTDKKPDENS